MISQVLGTRTSIGTTEVTSDLAVRGAKVEVEERDHSTQAAPVELIRTLDIRMPKSEELAL